MGGTADAALHAGIAGVAWDREAPPLLCTIEERSRKDTKGGDEEDKYDMWGTGVSERDERTDQSSCLAITKIPP
jgi:hypothetical protein